MQKYNYEDNCGKTNKTVGGKPYHKKGFFPLENRDKQFQMN